MSVLLGNDDVDNIDPFLASKPSITERIKKWWNNRKYEAENTRDLAMGITISAAVCELVPYILIRQQVKLGTIPDYVTDALMIFIAGMEVMFAPLIGWYGYRSRRNVICTWMSVFIVASLPSLLLPAVVQPNDGAELCLTGAGPEQSGSVYLRVSLLVVVTCACVFARIGITCHFFAYIGEHSVKRISVQLGVLIMVRMISYCLGYNIVLKSAENKLWMQVLITVVPVALLNVPQVLWHPRYPPGSDMHTVVEGRGFLESMQRVLSNKLVMSQMLSAGLFVAAFFGVAFYSNDIMKTKFLAIRPTSYIHDLLMYFMNGVLVALVFLFGFMDSDINKYEAKACVRRVLSCCFWSIIVLQLLTHLTCTPGPVAGLDGHTYLQPQCSISCGCGPAYNEFNPVCDVDTMTTYSTPCEAGCLNITLLNGVQSLSNCLCGSGRMVVGACSESNCQTNVQAHKMLLILATAITVLALQSHTHVIFQEVDQRDYSSAVGVASAVVTFIALICGHVVYFLFSVSLCAWWSESGRCMLQDQRFPLAVGLTSTAFILIAFVFNIVVLRYVKKQEKAAQAQEIAEGSRQSTA